MLNPILSYLAEAANGIEGKKSAKDIWVSSSGFLCRIRQRVRFQRCDPRDFGDNMSKGLFGDRL
eukprot:9152488-Pyramimonas_sp.AAC.1